MVRRIRQATFTLLLEDQGLEATSSGLCLVNAMLHYVDRFPVLSPHTADGGSLSSSRAYKRVLSPLESLHDVNLLALSRPRLPWPRSPSSTLASAVTTMVGRKLTADELAAHAEANGYKRREH